MNRLNQTMKKLFFCVTFAIIFAWATAHAAPKSKTIKINEHIYFSGLVEKKAPAGEGTMAVFLNAGLGIDYAKLLETVKTLKAIPEEYQNRPEIIEAKKTLGLIKMDVLEGIFHDGTVSDGMLTLSSGADITGNFTYQVFENKIVFQITDGKIHFEIKKGSIKMTVPLESPFELTRQWTVYKAFLIPNEIPFDWTVSRSKERLSTYSDSDVSYLTHCFWLLSQCPSESKETRELSLNLETGEEGLRSRKVTLDYGGGYSGYIDKDLKMAALSSPISSDEVCMKNRSDQWEIEKYHWTLDGQAEAEITMTGEDQRMTRKSFLTGPCRDLLDTDLLRRLDEIPQQELNETISKGNRIIHVKYPSGEVYHGLVSRVDLSKPLDVAKLKKDLVPDLGVKVSADGIKTVILKEGLTLGQKEEAYQAELKRLEEERLAHEQMLSKLPSGIIGAWEEYVRKDPSGFLIQGVYNFKKDGSVVYETRCGFSDWVEKKLGVYSVFAVKGAYTLDEDRLGIHLDMQTINLDEMKFVYAPDCVLKQSDRAQMETEVKRVLSTGMRQLVRSQIRSDTAMTATSFSKNEIQFTNNVRLVRPIQDILK